MEDLKDRVELLQRMLEGAIQANHDLHRTIRALSNDGVEERERTINDLAEAVRLLIQSTSDIPGFDVQAVCPIAFGAARKALERVESLRI